MPCSIPGMMARAFSFKLAGCILGFPALALGLLAAAAPRAGAAASSSAPWPRLRDADPAGYDLRANSKACRALRRYTMGNHLDVGSMMNTDTVMVIQDRRIVWETYEAPFTENTPHLLWSGSKYITALIAGTALKEGRLDLDARVNDFYPAEQLRAKLGDADTYRRITVRDLLLMQSGIDWKEYGETHLDRVSVLDMLFSPAASDMAAFVASQPLVAGPGARFNYSSGDFTLLMGILKKIYGPEYAEMPWRNLFRPVGIRSAVLQRDLSGSFVGGAYMMLSTQDLARLGQLVIDGGVWEGRQVLTPEFLAFMRQPLPMMLDESFALDKLNDITPMGIAHWENAAIRGEPRPHPAWPADTFMAIGLWGQTIIMVPSQHLVVVRTGTDPGWGHRIDPLGQRLAACLRALNAPAVGVSQ